MPCICEKCGCVVSDCGERFCERCLPDVEVKDGH